MSKILASISEKVVDCQTKKVEELVRQALAEGVPAKQILNEGLMSGMVEIGVLFKDGEVFVPEVLVAAKAMGAGVEILKPHLQAGDVGRKGKVMLVTVKGDLHDIGIKLVGMMLEGAGYETVNIGIDVSAETVVEEVEKQKPDILGMSAMLTTTMTEIKEVMKAIKEAGLNDGIKVMIGGAPITERYADEVGASYANDATTAVEVADRLLKGE